MDQVRKAYLLLVASTLGLFLWVASFSVYAFISNRHRSAEGQQSRDALCVLKQDLINRHNSGVEFLKDNPNGTPGIPKSVILNSLKGQESTIKALKNLKCA
jgi:hypothetical protein